MKRFCNYCSFSKGKGSYLEKCLFRVLAVQAIIPVSSLKVSEFLVGRRIIPFRALFALIKMLADASIKSFNINIKSGIISALHL